MTTVTVIGGGVSGLTTAAYLEGCGYDTTIKTKDVAYQRGEDEGEIHGLATEYAAASVIPTNDHQSTREMFETSQTVFSKIADVSQMPVRRIEHTKYAPDSYELPEYAEHLHNLDAEVEGGRLELDGRDVSAQWTADVYMVDMPAYIPQLRRIYEAMGGDIETGVRVDFDSFDPDATAVVNCTGVWSRDLVPDDTVKCQRGHLLIADPVPRNDDGEPEDSYLVETTDGEKLYSYPREDRLVLGGSREIATPHPEDEWDEPVADETVTVDGLEIPKEMVDLHREALSEAYGVEFDDLNLTSCYGYRPYRERGARVEKGILNGCPIVHNYGHGGCGVTLSWGAAEKVESKLPGGTGERPFMTMAKAAMQVGETDATDVTRPY